jgi:hypothetical protein
MTLRVDLEAEAAENFLLLKKRLGLKNNSELIRFLISEAVQRLKLKEA